MQTSCVRSYLIENLVEQFVRRCRTESEPGERVVFAAAEDLVERLRSVPAEMRHVVVSQQCDVRPAVPLGDHLKRARESAVGAGDADHCVVGGYAVQCGVDAALRKERTIPVRHDVASIHAHWTAAVHTTGFETRDCENKTDTEVSLP